jgi:hypothetical protein
MALNATALRIYNDASRAAVSGSRIGLARALREARQYDGDLVVSERYGPVKLAQLCVWHASFIDWPIRLRPNGRYL